MEQTSQEYRTNDKGTVIALFMLKHTPLRHEVVGETQIEYIFDLGDIGDHLNKILNNHLEDLTVTIKDWVAAEYVWNSNLRHVQGGARRRRGY